MGEVTLETVYKEVRDLDILVETIDVLANPKELEGIRKGLTDIREGRTRSWDELKKELKSARALFLNCSQRL